MVGGLVSLVSALAGTLHRYAMWRISKIEESVKELGANGAGERRARMEGLIERVEDLEREWRENVRPALHTLNNFMATIQAILELRKRGIDPFKSE